MNRNKNAMNHRSNELEGTDWETRYQNGDTPWDKGVAAPPLVDFLTRYQIRGRVLVPGSGPGHDVRILASHGASATGLDLSDTAIHQALNSPRVAGEIHERGNLFALPSSWSGRFDWVVEHTCFCAIDPDRRADYVHAITGVLKPGGELFAIFYLNPEADQGPPFGITKEEIGRLFDPKFELLEEWVPMQAFSGRKGRELCQLRRRNS